MKFKTFILLVLQVLLLNPLFASEDTLEVRKLHAQDLSLKFKEAQDISSQAQLQALNGKEFLCVNTLNDLSYDDQVSLTHRIFQVTGNQMVLSGLNYNFTGAFNLEQGQVLSRFQSDDGGLNYASHVRVLSKHEVIFEMSRSTALAIPAYKARSKASGMPVISWNLCRARMF